MPTERGDPASGFGSGGAAGTSTAAPGSQEDLTQSAGDRIFFDTDRNTLTPQATATLDRQTAWLQQYPQVNIWVAGNCDERGTEEYNLALGQRRANADRDYLVAHGIQRSRIETISYGKSRPIDRRVHARGLGTKSQRNHLGALIFHADLSLRYANRPGIRSSVNHLITFRTYDPLFHRGDDPCSGSSDASRRITTWGSSPWPVWCASSSANHQRASGQFHVATGTSGRASSASVPPSPRSASASGPPISSACSPSARPCPSASTCRSACCPSVVSIVASAVAFTIWQRGPVS